MIFAVSNINGLIHHALLEGSTTADTFNSFLEATIPHLISNNLRKVFIFDNASVHNRADEATIPNNIQIKYLPPYNPFLNIVENTFSVWEAALKRELAEVRPHML